MPTTFSFEHEFRAASPETILAAYFDADHLATQDRAADLTGRVVVENHDDAALRRCVWRVTAAKPLPMFVRPVVTGGQLAYLEAMTWHRATTTAQLVVSPQLLGGRVEFSGSYQLTQAGPGRVHRRYAGTITANITLLSGKIERGILAEFEKSMPLMAACTQGWLDRAAG